MLHAKGQAHDLTDRRARFRDLIIGSARPDHLAIGCRWAKGPGVIATLADSYQGRRLDSPNDVIVDSHGAIWFTDPTYGIRSDYEGYHVESEQPVRGLYRLGPTGQLDCVAGDFLQPNGLCLSPDERILYVADSGTRP